MIVVGKKEVFFPVSFAGKTLLILTVLLLVPVVSAQQGPNQPFVGASTTGYTISVPPVSFIKEKTDFTAHIHVFNNTNGKIINYTNCQVHLYDTRGNELAEETATLSSNGIEYEALIDGNNFTVGLQEFRVFCFDSASGGFIDGLYYVSSSGLPVAEGSLLTFLLLLFVILMGTVTYLFAFNIGKALVFETDILDVAINLGAFFMVVTLQLLLSNYWIDLNILNLVTLTIKIMVFTNVLVPITFFIISIIFGTLRTNTVPNVFRRVK